MNNGKLFIIAGVFLIIISLTMTFYNKYEDLNAGKQAREALDVFKSEVIVQNHIVESLTTEEVKEMKTVNINGDEFIGTITIPTLNLELPVMSEYSYSRLKKAPCRYYGNLFTNDLIICAHAYETFFANLIKLKQNDIIVFTDVDGNNVGLFITGPSSSGKSYPLIALCNEFVRGGKTCSFIEVRNFFEELKSTLDHRDQYSILMSKVKEADVLVLDNLGDEKISEWVRDDILAGILDYRAKNELLTYITSSYTIDELISLYNVTKTGASDVGRIKANKFVERVKSVCPKQIVIEGK